MNTESNVAAVVFAVFLAGGSPAFAHDDDHHKADEHEGHATTLGEPGDPGQASRTIDVEMSDAMRFSPAAIKVKRGETIKQIRGQEYRPTEARNGVRHHQGTQGTRGVNAEVS